MYTSDIDEGRRRVLRCAAGNLLFAAFCALFGAVYEHFSFGVYSWYMIYAFAYPLAAGIFLVFAAAGRRRVSRLALDLISAAAVTFAVGSIAAGVVKIYGTENRLLIAYPIAGGVLLVLAAVAMIRGKSDSK